jgi:transmembrane sensor
MPPISDFQDSSSGRDRLEQESFAWVNLLFSGTMTTGKGEAFRQWRAQSPAHERAFIEAIRFRRAVGDAIRAGRAEGAAFDLARPHDTASRRAFLGGGGLAAAAVAAYAMVQPPAGLWPSLAELMSDYRTGKGEQRDLSPAQGVVLALNTDSAVSVHGFGRASPGLRLISGEAGLTVDRGGAGPFVVAAGAGRLLTRRASFDVRDDGREVCVTCLDGGVDVVHPKGARRLAAGEDLRYSRRDLGIPAATDTAVASAWRRGLLIFRNAPLQQVVDELNRYRPGRIVLLDKTLGQRQVYAVFQLKRLAGAVEQVRELTGVRETVLPGGLVVFG